MGKLRKRNLSLLFIHLAILSLAVVYPGIVYADKKVDLYFFWGYGCPHCTKEKEFLEKLQQKYPHLEIKSYEVWHDRENAKLFVQMAEAYGIKAKAVPTTFIGNFEPIVGYRGDEVTGTKIEDRLIYCIKHICIDPFTLLQKPAKKEPVYEEEGKIVNLPVFGKIDTSKMALPALTIILAGLDSFNPCAFFVLFLLLSILVYARSRKRMLLIGGTFVFFSGFIYFLFMSAWLNLFLHSANLR